MPNRTVNHNNRNKLTYQVDGNTVRRMEAMPDYRKRAQRQTGAGTRGRAEKTQTCRDQKSGKSASHEQSYVVFLTMAVTVFGIFCGAYIKLQSDVTARMKKIASLESQVTDLKADNDGLTRELIPQ